MKKPIQRLTDNQFLVLETYSGSFTGSGALSGSFTGSFTGSLTSSYGSGFTGSFSGSLTSSYGSGSSFTGSFTGSMSGSFTGSFSGSFEPYTGSLITGSFTGSYSGSLTGSFSGSAFGPSVFGNWINGTFKGLVTSIDLGSYFTGSLTGSFSGSLSGSYTSGSSSNATTIGDSWTSDVTSATLFTHGEYVNILEQLSETYEVGQLVKYNKGPKELFNPTSFAYVFQGYVLKGYVDYESN
jgi:hypothetical protein